MKNLNYFISARIPNKKAHSVQVLKMCDELAKRYKVNLICENSDQKKKIWHNYNLKNSFKISNIKIFHSKILNIICKIFYLLKFKSKDDDILFTRDVHYAFFGLMYYKEIYLELHLTYLNKFQLSFHLLKYIFKLVNVKVIFISKELSKIYKKKISYPKNYVIAHDCSDDNFIKNFQIKKKRNKLSVGYCGHLYTGRGIEIIVNLAKIEQDIEFNILGGFKDDRDKIKKNNYISKNINFYNHVIYRDTSKFLRSNDILIAPYKKKLGKTGEIDTSKYMSPLKIFEYMSSFLSSCFSL